MNKRYDPTSEKSILEYAKELEGKSINMFYEETRLEALNFDYEDVSIKSDDLIVRESNNKTSYRGNKGGLGHIVEKEYFGYDINSKKEADFEEVGVELKVIPIKEINKKPKSDMLIKQHGLSVKERVVLSIINFEEIINETWETTSLRMKLDKILMMYYMHQPNVNIRDLIFMLSRIWNPEREDLKILKKDWELIKKKIEEGRAHELSEGDTLLLGACTKGATSNSKRTQPNSDIPAMQRAYSLKRGYVDNIFNSLYSDSQETYRVIPVTIYDTIIDNFKNIRNLTLEEIRKKYDIEMNRKPKNFLSNFMKDIFFNLMGVSIKEFNENNVAEIEVKTILMNSKNKVKESMSFEQINYDELIEEEWEESKFRDKFENKKMLWIIFKSNRTYKNQSELNLDEIIFHDLFYWNIPNEDLDNDVRELWKDTVEKVKDRNFDNFKKISETKVAHIRPKGKDGNDLATLNDGTKVPKKTYWLNAKYVEEQISNNLQKLVTK